jgi:hypothetical protein
MSRHGIFTNGNLDAVMAVARRQVERLWQPGERIWTEGDRADYGFSIRHGRVRCWSDDGPRRSQGRAGDSLGFLEGLACSAA